MQNLVCDEMKLNKFVDVQLPKNKVLFQRCQNMSVRPGSHDVPTADFTSRNIESIAQSERVVMDDYNEYLRQSQMPLDTDIDSVEESSEHNS